MRGRYAFCAITGGRCPLNWDFAVERWFASWADHACPEARYQRRSVANPHCAYSTLQQLAEGDGNDE
jgi:hypothetical protein